MASSEGIGAQGRREWLAWVRCGMSAGDVMAGSLSAMALSQVSFMSCIVMIVSPRNLFAMPARRFGTHGLDGGELGGSRMGGDGRTIRRRGWGRRGWETSLAAHTLRNHFVNLSTATSNRSRRRRSRGTGLGNVIHLVIPAVLDDGIIYGTLQVPLPGPALFCRPQLLRRPLGFRVGLALLLLAKATGAGAPTPSHNDDEHENNQDHKPDDEPILLADGRLGGGGIVLVPHYGVHISGSSGGCGEKGWSDLGDSLYDRGLKIFDNN